MQHQPVILVKTTSRWHWTSSQSTPPYCSFTLKCCPNDTTSRAGIQGKPREKVYRSGCGHRGVRVARRRFGWRLVWRVHLYDKLTLRRPLRSRRKLSFNSKSFILPLALKSSLEPSSSQPRLMRDVFSGCEVRRGIGRNFSSARRARTLVGSSGCADRSTFIFLGLASWPYSVWRSPHPRVAIRAGLWPF
jgi:hypothetical protein